MTPAQALSGAGSRRALNVDHAHIRSRNYVESLYAALVARHSLSRYRPRVLRLGPLQFRWYGLMYLIGLTLAYFIEGAQARHSGYRSIRITSTTLIVYAAVGVRRRAIRICALL